MTSPYLDRPLRSEAEAVAMKQDDQRIRDAAPDLLTALESLLHSIPDTTHNRQSSQLAIAWGQANAAIAKAHQ